jgi:hypothetical protein
LEDKIVKLQNDLIEQKERENALRTLHSDEIKYMSDMNGHELKLYESKIKELEGNNQSLQKYKERTDRSHSPNFNLSISRAFSNSKRVSVASKRGAAAHLTGECFNSDATNNRPQTPQLAMPELINLNTNSKSQPDRKDLIENQEKEIQEL